MKKGLKVPTLIDKDNPEWTEADFARAKTFDQLAPELQRKLRGPQKAPTKTPVSLRLSKDVIDIYRATGSGWQSRIDDDLKFVQRIRANPGSFGRLPAEETEHRSRMSNPKKRDGLVMPARRSADERARKVK